MIEEAALGTTVTAPGRSCQQEIAVMVEQANPSPIAISPCLNKSLSPVDIQTPEIFRSEDEQLVGHELIETLSKFKLSKVPPLSPPSHHETTSSFEAIVVHPKENQSSYLQRKVKSKSRKPCFKVVRDLLTKKWIIVKKDRDFFEMTLLLKTLGVRLQLLLVSCLVVISLLQVIFLCQQVSTLVGWESSFALLLSLLFLLYLLCFFS
jgi:hypothetical protein